MSISEGKHTMTTTSSNGAIIDQVEGLVETVNDRGIKVGGEWRNLSKFHPLELPGQGARVRLTLDSKGFIRTLDLVDGAPTTNSATPTARDRTITRLAVLKAAANFLGLMSPSREEVKSEHVLVLADKWLAWVEQSEDED
jgi:hypothetical protein